MSDTTLKEEDVRQTITNYNNNSNDFQIKEYNVNSASDDILGFMGEHARLAVTFIKDGKENHQTFFVKKIPTTNESHREYAEKSKCFYKEIELYKTIFDDIENATNKTKRWRPKCYLTRDWELMIAEDLTPQGFTMLQGRALLNLQHVLVTLKALARMHAGSIILEEKLKLRKTTTHSPFSAAEKFTIGELYPNLIFESECTNEIGHPGFTFWTIYNMVKPSDKYRNVIVHGDLWGNNILFRYDENGDPVEAVLVDFQMARYAPPAHDLMMFLQIVQDNDFRRLHKADILKFFYERLGQELKEEGLNVEEQLPYTEYQESCEYYQRYAVLNQVTYTQLNLTPAHLVKKFMATQEAYDKVISEDRSELLVESYLTDDLCCVRTIEAMNNVINMFGLI